MRPKQLLTDSLRQSFHLSTHTELADTVGVGGLGLSPDAVLPEQFYRPPCGAAHRWSEVALRRAVLDDAINCYQKHFVIRTRRGQRLATETEAWFFDNDERWPFSFVNICRALGLEPEYLRQGLKQWCQHPLAEPQRK